MKLFELSHSEYDGYNSTLYTHKDDNKSEKDFENDVKELTRQYENEYFDREISWSGIGDIISFISGKMNERGYEYAKVESYNQFDGSILLPGYIKKEQEAEHKDFLGEKFYNRCVKHNIKIDEEI